MTRYAKSISNYPRFLPDGKIAFFKAYQDIGSKYFGSYWHFDNALHSLDIDKKMEKFISSLLPLSKNKITHNDIKEFVSLLNTKYSGYKIVPNEYIFGLTKESSHSNDMDLKLMGTQNIIPPEKYKSLHHSIKYTIDMLGLDSGVRFPYFYRLIQYNVLFYDMLHTLNKGSLNSINVVATLLSRCGHLTNVPSSVWLTNDFNFSLNKDVASFTEYNSYISETTYKGKLLLDIEFVNEYLNTIMQVKQKENNIAEFDCSATNKPEIKVLLPQISPTNTESWKDDVEMAFTDYYNENKVAPKPKKLCSYIKDKKKDNESYAQYISAIKFNAPLTIVNGSIKEAITWDTFGKAITATKKRILVRA